MTALTLIILLACVVRVAAANTSKPRLALRTSEAIVAVWGCEDKLGRDRTHARSPWKPHSAGFRRAELNRWVLKRKACLAVLHEQARQWAWERWLPDHGRRLATCESGLRWDRGVMHSTDGTFVSAFAISTREYDRDAALMGVRPWYVRGRPDPSPWEQWLAAIGHYKRFGDGWTGRCHGIMR